MYGLPVQIRETRVSLRPVDLEHRFALLLESRHRLAVVSRLVGQRLVSHARIEVRKTVRIHSPLGCRQCRMKGLALMQPEKLLQLNTRIRIGPACCYGHPM